MTIKYIRLNIALTRTHMIIWTMIEEIIIHHCLNLTIKKLFKWYDFSIYLLESYDQMHLNATLLFESMHTESPSGIIMSNNKGQEQQFNVHEIIWKSFLIVHSLKFNYKQHIKWIVGIVAFASPSIHVRLFVCVHAKIPASNQVLAKWVNCWPANYNL